MDDFSQSFVWQVDDDGTVHLTGESCTVYSGQNEERCARAADAPVIEEGVPVDGEQCGAGGLY